MPDSAQVRSAVDAAERAATAGDFTVAAQHLRQALAFQEQELGPTHPDVASTLNNLGVVSERIGDFAAAERCYRRACEIVTAAFPPEHPFVETSRQNLAAFCEARAVPLETTPQSMPESPRPAPPVPQPAVAAPPPLPQPAIAVPRRASPSPGAGQTPGRLPVVPLIAAAVIVIGFVLWFSRSRGADTSSAGSAATPVATTPALTPPTPAAPAPGARTSAPDARSTTPPPPARGAATHDGSPSVVDAQLCRSLTRAAEWTCARVSDPVGPGHLYFYTRVATTRDIVIVHRWYRDDRVQLNRELQIGANTTPGYRTFSHLLLDAKSAGQWRVELRTVDGRILREERFVVR